MDFPQQIVEEFPQVTAWFLEHGTRILLVIVLAVVGYRLFFVLARHVKLRVQRSDGIPDSTLDKRAETLFNVITSAGLAVVATAATLTILQEVGVEIGPLLASVGIVGLALGLGAQTLVKDVINGLFVLIENQYTVGDVIEVNGLAGRVEEMTLRVTMLRDLQGVLHFIPNSEIRIVSNRSREWSRAVVEVGITYETDVDLAMDTLRDIGQRLRSDSTVSPLAIEDPVVTGVEGLEDWQVRLRFMVKTEPGEQYAVERYLRREIQRVFAEKGIPLASPRQEVILFQQENRETSESGGGTNR